MNIPDLHQWTSLISQEIPPKTEFRSQVPLCFATCKETNVCLIYLIHWPQKALGAIDCSTSHGHFRKRKKKKIAASCLSSAFVVFKKKNPSELPIFMLLFSF